MLLSISSKCIIYLFCSNAPASKAKEVITVQRLIHHHLPHPPFLPVPTSPLTHTHTHTHTFSPQAYLIVTFFCSPVSPRSLVHLKKPPVFSLLPLTPNRGWSNYSSNLIPALPQRRSCFMCVSLCVFLIQRKKRHCWVCLGRVWGAVNHLAMQGVVRYHWLWIKAGICVEAASIQLFIALPVAAYPSLFASSSLLLIFHQHILLVFVDFCVCLSFIPPSFRLLNCLYTSLSLSLCLSLWVSLLARINKGLLTFVCPLWRAQWASWDFRQVP